MLQECSTYCTLADHIRHTILSKVVAGLSISIHGDDAREGIIGMDVIFVSMDDESHFFTPGKRGKYPRIKENANSSKMIYRLYQRPNLGRQSHVLALATEYRAWLSSFARNPQCKTISEKVRCTTRYLRGIEVDKYQTKGTTHFEFDLNNPVVRSER